MPIYLVADLPRDVPALLPLHSVALLSRNLNKMIILRDLKSHGIPNVSHGFLRIVVYLFAAALIRLKKSIMNEVPDCTLPWPPGRTLVWSQGRTVVEEPVK